MEGKIRELAYITYTELSSCFCTYNTMKLQLEKKRCIIVLVTNHTYLDTLMLVKKLQHQIFYYSEHITNHNLLISELLWNTH